MRKQFNIMHLVLDLDFGGLQFVVLNLIKKFNTTEFRPSVTCILNGGNLIEEVKNIGCKVEIVNKPDKLDFSASLKIARILKAQDIALIHTHNTAAYLYGSLAAKLAGVALIIHTEHGRDFPDKRRLMVAEKVLSSFTHKIVAVSEELKEALVKFERINPKKITVITNGVDLELFKSMPKSIIKQKKYEIGIDKNDFVIGNIGRLTSVKDHRNLIQAFQLIHKDMPDAKLLIVGDGPLKEDLSNFSQSLGLQRNILFLGERKDIPELLNIFDIFVLPSKNEGVSLTLLEAMATKKPVVATSVGGNKEIIEHGKDGYLVPPCSPKKLREAVLDMVKSNGKAEQLGIAAYEEVKEKYSLEKMAKAYQEIYESALSAN
jgi:sugar transferase (PEP-CTERM/EpsH1 system associated)